MEKILEILITLPIKTVVDYLLIIVPIVLSCIAIAISIVTTRKQNKIALFELRYKCFSQLKTIDSFSNSLQNCDNPEIVIKMFDALWGVNIANMNKAERLIGIRCQLEIIAHDVMQDRFLFGRKFDIDFEELVKCMLMILADASVGVVNKESKSKLFQMCQLLRKKDVPYMQRKLKI